MRLFPADWQGFLDDVALWGQLSIPARTTFLDGMRPGLSVEAAGADAADELRDAGLLSAGAGSGYPAVDPRFSRFHQLLKTLEHISIFDAPGFEVLRDYLSEHFTLAERSLLHESFAFHPNDFGRIASLVTSVEWLEEFLARDRFQAPVRESAAAHAAGLGNAREMLRFFMEQRTHVPLRDLEEYFPSMDRRSLGSALRLGVQAAVFFVSLRRSDREPLVGIWPSAARRLRQTAIALAPGPASPEKSFRHPFLLEDMTTVLLASVADPIPVRRSDEKPFARFEEDQSGLLLSLPAWMEEFTGATPRMRVGSALKALRLAGFLREEKDGDTLRLRPSPPGRQWAEGAIGEKLHGFLRRAAPGTAGKAAGLLALLLGSRTGWSDAGEDILPALVQAFTSAPRSSFIRFRDFGAYQAAIANPLIPLRERGEGTALWSGLDGLPTDEGLENVWQSILHAYLSFGLLPLGGAEAGLTASGQACFRITATGRSLLEAGESPEEEAEPAREVVVQPSFEVVFLAPCPPAEAEIARFSERLGREVGALFRITRGSVLRAAASGLGVERVLSSLARSAKNPVPPNVEHEIRGWFERGADHA